MDNNDQTSVSDSTDWLPTSIPLFSEVDAALRCQICKDFYEAAVITNCAHTFCSKCIRRAIAADGKCPSCRTNASEHQLRRNVAVQEIVYAYGLARLQALEVARREKAAEENTQKSLPSRETRGAKRKREEAGTDSDSHIEQRQLRARRSQRQSAKQTDTDTAKMNNTEREVIDIDQDEDVESTKDDDDYQPESSPQKQQQPDDGLVPCPICQTRMKEDAVYTHLDSCTGQPNTIASSSSNTTKTPKSTSIPSTTLKRPSPPVQNIERLPQPNYSLFKENDLRRKLLDLKIPATGSKDMLIRRHKEWVNIWNSNADSLRPRSRNELLRDLDHWERTEGKSTANASSDRGRGPVGAAFSSASSIQNQNLNVMAKDFNAESYAKHNKSDFDALIANARKGRDKALATSKEKNESESAPGNSGEKPDEKPDGSSASPSLDSPKPLAKSVEGKPTASLMKSPPLPSARSPSIKLSPRSNRETPTPTPEPNPRKWTPSGTEEVQPNAAEPGVATLGKEDSFTASMSEAPTKGRKLPMFQLPSEPVVDSDIGDLR